MRSTFAISFSSLLIAAREWTASDFDASEHFSNFCRISRSAVNFERKSAWVASSCEWRSYIDCKSFPLLWLAAASIFSRPATRLCSLWFCSLRILTLLDIVDISWDLALHVDVMLTNFSFSSSSCQLRFRILSSWWVAKIWAPRNCSDMVLFWRMTNCFSSRNFWIWVCCSTMVSWRYIAPSLFWTRRGDVGEANCGLDGSYWIGLEIGTSTRFRAGSSLPLFTSSTSDSLEKIFFQEGSIPRFGGSRYIGKAPAVDSFQHRLSVQWRTELESN